MSVSPPSILRCGLHIEYLGAIRPYFSGREIDDNLKCAGFKRPEELQGSGFRGLGLRAYMGLGFIGFRCLEFLV